MSELKPCPDQNCLGRAISSYVRDGGHVGCSTCGLGLTRYHGRGYWGADKAADDWNAVARPPETPAIGPEVTQADRDCLHTMGIPASADDLAIVAAHRIQSTAALAQGDATDKDYIVDIDHKGNFYNVPLSEWNKGNKP